MFGHHPAQQQIHRKSRQGCKICKARKFKCDEVRPVCGNRTRRFPNPETECEVEITSQSIGRSPPAPTGVQTPISNAGTSSSTARSMELRLFHHYSTVTSFTMPLCEEPAGIYMWTMTIPSLAFESPYVYNALLAITALHLLTLNPTDIALQAASHQYIDETISTYREEINSIDSTNSLPLFSTSILLSIYTKLRSRYLENSDTSYILPLDYFYLQAGARELFYETREFIEGSGVKAYIDLVPERNPSFPTESVPYTYQDIFPHDPLPEFITTSISLTPARVTSYTNTLSYLALLKICITHNEATHWIPRRLCCIPSGVPEDFVRLLEEYDPIAIVILAFFCLLKFEDETWLLEGTAKYEVGGLKGLEGSE